MFGHAFKPVQAATLLFALFIKQNHLERLKPLEQQVLELQVQQQQVPQEPPRLLQDPQVDKVDRQGRQQLQVLRLVRLQGRRLPQLLREPLVLVSSFERQELLVPLELQLLVQVLQLKMKINVSQENMKYWKVEASG